MHHILVSWCKIPTAHHRFTEARINPANASFALVRPHSINAHTATAQPAAGFIFFDTTALEHPQRVTVMLGVKNKERARLLWGHGNLF